MNINIKNKLTDEELEQLKYEMILHKKVKANFGYDWNLQGEKTSESIEDFHLFCISIVKDLFENNFKTNELGELKYIENNENEEILEELDYLYSIILNKKFNND